MAEFNALIRSNYSTKSCFFFSQHDDELFSLSVKLLLAWSVTKKMENGPNLDSCVTYV